MGGNLEHSFILSIGVTGPNSDGTHHRAPVSELPAVSAESGLNGAGGFVYSAGSFSDIGTVIEADKKLCFFNISKGEQRLLIWTVEKR